MELTLAFPFQTTSISVTVKNEVMPGLMSSLFLMQTFVGLKKHSNAKSLAAL
jgi:hypothetical protein